MSANEKMVKVPRQWAQQTVNAGPGEYLSRSDIDLLSEALNQPAEQGQGEPVALPTRRQWNGLGNAADNLKASGWNACLDKIAELGPLYQRTDAEFIALLERDRRVHCGAIHAQAGELAELRTQLAEAQALLRDLDDAWNSHDGKERFGKLMQKVEALSASAEPSATGDGVRDERDYAIEHAGYLADAADQVLADYQAYSLAQMLENEGGDDGDGEHAEAVDSARDELHEGLANLRSMTYEFRKRRPRSNPAPL